MALVKVLVDVRADMAGDAAAECGGVGAMATERTGWMGVVGVPAVVDLAATGWWGGMWLAEGRAVASAAGGAGGVCRAQPGGVG